MQALGTLPTTMAVQGTARPSLDGPVTGSHEGTVLPEDDAIVGGHGKTTDQETATIELESQSGVLHTMARPAGAAAIETAGEIVMTGEIASTGGDAHVLALVCVLARAV